MATSELAKSEELVSEEIIEPDFCEEGHVFISGHRRVFDNFFGPGLHKVSQVQTCARGGCRATRFQVWKTPNKPKSGGFL